MSHPAFINIKSKIPDGAIPYVAELLNDFSEVQIHLVNPRKTKYGDYKIWRNQFHITLNNNLNPYRFLITLVHELAHHRNHIQFPKSKAHGKEWKLCYKTLMMPLLRPSVFPELLLKNISLHLINPKASSDRDVNLSLALSQYDEKDDKNYIFELQFGDDFILNNKIFSLREKKRSRHVCIEKETNKKYSIQGHAKVNKINYE